MLAPNLPTALTRFVGRQAEVEQIGRDLAARRLVTLTGPGGVGKTRLAMAVGATRRTSVCWVDLGSLTDPDAVPAVVAAALGVRTEPDRDPTPSLARQLGTSELLLCLDTCEHLLPAPADLAATLLTTCPGLSVLATSREPLQVAGEAVWPVPPLNSADSAQLFVDRAELASPGFDAAAQQEHVHAACARLDGLPLAIELAAAWARTLSPAQILAGLDTSFRLLAGGPRGAPARQRTLEASMAWSHNLLDESDRVVLRRLAVMRGSFTAPDAAAVVQASDANGQGDLTSHLRRLVDRSLVMARTIPGDTEYRYSLLDTVMQYAADRLDECGETDHVRGLHLDHYLDLAEQAEAGLDQDEDRWRVTLAKERHNLIAALSWGLSNPNASDRARRLAAAMSRQWLLEGMAHEGLGFLDSALAVDPDDRSAVQASLYAARAMLGMVSGRAEATAESADRGGQIAAEVDDQRSVARCLAMVAYQQFFLDFDRCLSLAVSAHDSADAAGDLFARDWALIVQAYCMTRRDRHGEAVALARTAATNCSPRGDRFCGAFAAGVEVFAAMYTGRVHEAVRIADDMMQMVRPLGDYFAVGTNAATAAVALGLNGQIAAGLELMEPVIHSIEESEDVDVVGFMVTLGQLNLWAGDLSAALRWFSRGPAQMNTRFGHWTAVRCLPGLLATLRRMGRTSEARSLADQALAAATKFGGAYVRADILDELGYLAGPSNPARAADLHHQALQLRRQSGLRTFYADSLDALSAAAAHSLDYQLAVRLLAASTTSRESMGYPRPPVVAADHAAALEGLRAATTPEAFASAWEEGSELALDTAIASATRGRGPRGRPATGWESLTDTELEVARLVGRGYTNSQIAADLFVAVSTIKTHLVHIYVKLDISSRVALSTLAVSRLKQPTDPRP